MRLPSVKCILLMCLATTLATEEARPKRDLQFLKEVIAAKLGLTVPKPAEKDENVKILRIPGFDQVLMRAIPKVTVVEQTVPETIVQMNPTLAMLGSYLGTKTIEETLLALQGMRHLVQSGVMTARHDIVELAPQKQPIYVLPPPIVQQKADCPEHRRVYPMFESNVVPMPPVVQSFPPMPVLPSIPVLSPQPQRFIPVPAPPKIIMPDIKPAPVLPLVPVPLPTIISVPTKYSYTQTNAAEGFVTSYTSEGNQDVIITETNEPLPPPPSFIIDRLQKIVYGKPLGTPVPVPVPPPALDEVFVGSFYPEPLIPVIMERPDVNVKVNHYNRTKTGSKDMNNSHTAATEHEVVVAPKPLTVDDVPVVSSIIYPPPPEIVETPTAEDGDLFSYKHVHGDVSWSSNTGTESMREPFDLIRLKDISKLPPPPPELLKRIETIAGKAHKPWGYSLKTSNGISSYAYLDGDKIYYSRLESPSDTPGFPDPLSSPDNNEPKSPNKKDFIISYRDEFGNPFISTNVLDDSSRVLSEEAKKKDTKFRSDIKPMKKIPALPMPIAGENSKYHGFGSDGYSYTQVNHDGTIDTFSETGKETKNAVIMEAIKKIPALPAPIAQEMSMTRPTTVVKEHPSGFSYTQINKEGSVTTILGDRSVKLPVQVEDEVVNIPEQPAAVVDVIQPVKKIPCKSNQICKKNPSRYSYTQVNNNGGITKMTDGQVKAAVKVVNFPVPPAAIVDVVEPFPNPSPVVVVNEQNPGAFMFAEPVVSSYVYKQISHSNPQPFTVVKVADAPNFEVPVGEVHVKVNKHEHLRADGTTYPCTQVHKVVPDAPIPPIPTAEVVATVPEGFIYVPPLNADAPFPVTHNAEVNSTKSDFSYTHISSGTSTEDPTTTTVARANSDPEVSSSNEPISFSLNPIVVAPEGLKYSYTQKHSDGSSLKVQGNKDNTVTVTLEDNEVNHSDSERGDIPGASA